MGGQGKSVRGVLYWIFHAHPWSGAVLLFLSISLSAQKAPDTADGLYRQGLAALQHSNSKAAEADFRKAIRLSPAHADAHNLLGWILLSRRKLPKRSPNFGRL